MKINSIDSENISGGILEPLMSEITGSSIYLGPDATLEEFGFNEASQIEALKHAVIKAVITYIEADNRHLHRNALSNAVSDLEQSFTGNLIFGKTAKLYEIAGSIGRIAAEYDILIETLETPSDRFEEIESNAEESNDYYSRDNPSDAAMSGDSPLDGDPN